MLKPRLHCVYRTVSNCRAFPFPPPSMVARPPERRRMCNLIHTPAVGHGRDGYSPPQRSLMPRALFALVHPSIAPTLWVVPVVTRVAPEAWPMGHRLLAVRSDEAQARKPTPFALGSGASGIRVLNLDAAQQPANCARANLEHLWPGYLRRYTDLKRDGCQNDPCHKASCRPCHHVLPHKALRRRRKGSGQQ